MTLRERIKKENAAREKAERFLQEKNCHLCQQAIFTNDVPAYSRYMGKIGPDYDISTIKWNQLAASR